MPHVSRKNLDPETIQILDKALIAIFSELRLLETRSVINVFLTRTEKLMILKRLGILYLLQEKQSQEEIAKTLKTTRQTVARIDLQLLKIPEEDRNFVLQKLASWSQFTKFKQILKETSVWVAKKVLRASVGRA